MALCFMELIVWREFLAWPYVTGAYPNETFFGTRAKGPNPFAKNSDYSKPITDYTKDPSYVE